MFLVIESTVVGLKTKLVPILASVTLMLWMVFYFIQLTVVAFACDWFSKQVQCTKRLILRALAVYYEDKEDKVRKAAWEMLQLIEFEKPIFSVCGIVVLDKSLPFKLIGVITSNVLVFIQYTSNVLNTN
ncbi:uncharacterized protein [Choristoneura fumiferana]|uniref:uncharacterized protein n=1 Tax=Choristoneura fumiferana TaxID=7141 RepID=UPI003D15BE77